MDFILSVDDNPLKRLAYCAKPSVIKSILLSSNESLITDDDVVVFNIILVI